ncbi:hypothetical protein EVAR_59804_1 [Eumeta japonica]|uniref:Uncharacterized protein n=1 Tax=Eumeta variegata TaxID=151549 RepID=A0A4C1YEZ3_EUMVA|nr:hypothetical protein EVAR_59804_1 [Eumeta japonica]
MAYFYCHKPRYTLPRVIYFESKIPERPAPHAGPGAGGADDRGYVRADNVRGQWPRVISETHNENFNLTSRLEYDTFWLERDSLSRSLLKNKFNNVCADVSIQKKLSVKVGPRRRTARHRPAPAHRVIGAPPVALIH